jgi:hypothetical protein
MSRPLSGEYEVGSGSPVSPVSLASIERRLRGLSTEYDSLDLDLEEARAHDSHWLQARFSLLLLRASLKHAVWFDPCSTTPRGCIG